MKLKYNYVLTYWHLKKTEIATKFETVVLFQEEFFLVINGEMKMSFSRPTAIRPEIKTKHNQITKTTTLNSLVTYNFEILHKWKIL